MDFFWCLYIYYLDLFFIFSDFSIEIKDMFMLYVNFFKNVIVLSVMGGKLWEDLVNKRLYLYGGEIY